MAARIIIEERYSDPPSAGNGGYVSGMVAAWLGAGPVTVTLMKPTPLGRSLIVRDAGEDAIMLMGGEEVLVKAERAFVMPEAITPPAFTGVPPRPMVLRRLTISVHDRPQVGEDLMVLGWSIAHEGRRHEVGTGLYDRDGRCLAVGHATWIELKSRARVAA